LDTALTPDRVLEATVSLTREAVFATSEAAVADAILRIAGELVGADQGALGVVRDSEVVTVAALMPPRQPIGSHFPVGFGVAGWVAATGRSAEIQDVRQDKRYVALPYPEVRSFVGVPLQSRGEMLGVLSLAAWRPGAFKPGTAEALAGFAEAAALFLRRAAEDERRQQRLEMLEHAAREGLAESLHELKAPLHAAAGFLDLVVNEQTGPLNDLQKDFLQTARAECTRVKETLASLVEVSASAARRPLSVAEMDPAEFVLEMVDRARGQAHERDLQLVPLIAPELDPVLADAGAVAQVLTNFLQNAMRLAPRGSEIVVSTRSASGWTQFEVADRGPGVPEVQLEAIFERFRQGEGPVREAGTVGLGLAIARRIVQEHKGRIWAENREEGGARFCFALPSVSAETLPAAA
jgi:two-component system sensor histidine kinase KdpD